MKPEQREDKRYQTADFGTVSMEEELMFNMLEKYSTQQKKMLKVLDVGCGSGTMAKKINDSRHTVKGLDFSEEALKRAAARGIETQQCNLDEGIPELDNSYDVVWEGDIVEHVFDPIGLIKESARVLKENGVLLLTIPSDVGLISRVKMLFGISHQEQMYMTSGFYKHHTFFTPRLIRFMLHKAGFEIVEFHKILNIGKRYRVKYLPSLFFNEMVIQAKKNSEKIK